MVGKQVPVNKEILMWAIDKSQLQLSTLAEKIGVKREDIDNWISEDSLPPYNVLRKFAYLIKRPLAVFFLQNPPHEPSPEKYRTLPDTSQISFSKETINAFREAYNLHENSNELMTNLGIDAAPLINQYTIYDNPQKIAKQHRDLFGINEEVQISWKSAGECFSYYRNKIEEYNVFVHTLKIPILEARAFTLLEKEPISIFISNEDVMTARIFSLLHEFGHALLRSSSVCDIYDWHDVDKIPIEEKWCNEFASEVILPIAILKKINENMLSGIEIVEYNNVLTKISRKYKVSKRMTLYKLYLSSFITYAQYIAILNSLPTDGKIKSSGGANYYDTIRYKLGDKYISLVSDNVATNNISKYDASDYLSLYLEGWPLKVDKLHNVGIYV